jgi:aspartate racemase
MNDSTRPLLGVLGGMGPLATVDFLEKLIAETPAERDADPVPVVVWSVPQIPERPAAIAGKGPSPLPAMLEGIRALRQAGATAIAIPCNTAHYWYDNLSREAGVPILHIADAACDQFAARGITAKKIGLIGTNGTLSAGFYQQRLAARGLEVVLVSAAEQEEWVAPAIAAVKRHQLKRGHELAIRACERLRELGAQAIILACTETPIAVEFAPAPVAEICIDATRALAQACVAWWRRDSA